LNPRYFVLWDFIPSFAHLKPYYAETGYSHPLIALLYR
jgi:hypothetical protein